MCDRSHLSKPPSKREEGPILKRRVSRLVRPLQHIEGEHVQNFTADIEAMLAEPEFFDERDIKRLRYLLRNGVVPDDNAPGGYAVALSGRNWGGFVGIRRRFLDAKREKFFETLRNRARNFAFPDY